MYPAGVSVRRVEDITGALWGSRVSPNTISDLNQKFSSGLKSGANARWMRNIPMFSWTASG